MTGPGCQQLITGGIHQAYDQADGLKAHMNVTLIGYGNAQTSYNGKRVTCQHGSGECNALMVEDCAIKHNPAFEDHWPFVLCMENAGDNMLKQVKACATKANLDYSTIETCYKGAEGLQDLIDAGKRTGDHQAVPWILLNGKYSDKASNGNFLQAVCDEIAGDKPAGCSNSNLAKYSSGVAPPCFNEHPTQHLRASA